MDSYWYGVFDCGIVALATTGVLFLTVCVIVVSKKIKKFFVGVRDTRCRLAGVATDVSNLKMLLQEEVDRRTNGALAIDGEYRKLVARVVVLEDKLCSQVKKKKNK